MQIFDQPLGLTEQITRQQAIYTHRPVAGVEQVDLTIGDGGPLSLKHLQHGRRRRILGKSRVTRDSSPQHPQHDWRMISDNALKASAEGVASCQLG